MEDKPMARAKRDPRTKEEFLDRILRFDFDGDIRNIGAEPATIVRTGANALLLTFPESGVTFELSVHRPREFSQAAESRSFAPSTRGLRHVAPPAEAPAQEAPRRKRRTKAQIEADRQAANG
jgi:hypothetical protein